MRKLTLSEKINACHQTNEVLPLKGDLRFILEDVRDGTQQVEEVHNIATSALSSILSKNWSGLAQFYTLFPMRQWMGGVFCFQNAQTENASNFNPPNDLVNPLIAHAGDAANNTGSTLRGSPVTNDFVVTDTSIKQVWLWDNTQGNGHIESVSLVPAVLGNMGLKPFNDEFSPLSTFGTGAEVATSAFGEDEVSKYPFNISQDGKTHFSLYINGTSFKEITVRHDYFAFGIMRGSDDFQTVTSRTATIRNLANYIVFDDADYYYVANAFYDSQTSKYGLHIDKISKTTFAVTQADIQYDTITLYTGTIYNDLAGNFRAFGFDGTYLYFPNSAGTGFVKLNINDSSDKEALNGTMTIGMGRATSTADGKQYMEPIAINDGLILGHNYIINGANVYPIKQAENIGLDEYNYSSANLILDRKGAALYGKSYGARGGYYRGRQVNILCSMFLSSIANLPQARDKSTSQTLRVEYTTSENV